MRPGGASPPRTTAAGCAAGATPGWRRSRRSAPAENAGEIARGGALFEPDTALADPAPPPGDYDCRTVKLGTPQGDLLDYVAYPAFPLPDPDAKAAGSSSPS